MHIKRDISNWIIRIILSVLIVVRDSMQNYNLPVECNYLNLESDQSEPLGISSKNDNLRKSP